MSVPPVTIDLSTASVSRTCRVVVGVGHLESESSRADASFLIADDYVLGLHFEALGAAAELPGARLPRGEEAKTFSRLGDVLDTLSESGADRSSTLLAFGGGATCDISGLAAALFMRGISWVAAPTTLLAQVDAAVGGKTAINTNAGKNLVGAFHQPELVIADTSLLETLDDAELRSGLGEVIKTALLGAQVGESESLFEWLEQVQTSAIAARDPQLLATIVESCVRFKADVVAQDERESGLRKQLNLGHTFAHAIERVAGYGTIPHGVAVAAGIGDAIEVARREGILTESDLPSRYGELARRFGLPADTEDLRKSSGLALAEDELAEAMLGDKKNESGERRLVLPKALGEVTLDVNVSPFDSAS
jgi:3-dehydroquinate synthase